MPDGKIAVPVIRHRPGPAPVQSLAVACTLRSGSNLLCDVLRSNDFGEPKEWFQDRSRFDRVVEQAGSDRRLLDQQVRDLLAAHATCRWRSAKLDWQQFQRLRTLAPAVPAADAVLREMLGGEWIFLLRRNQAAQAVSLYAAQLTGAWMGEDAADYDQLPEDFDAIHQRFAAIAADAFAWEEFFRTTGVAPIRLFYEDLVSGDEATWQTLMGRLSPEFDPATLDLAALRAPPRKHRRLEAIKLWFQEQLLSGRQPRSVLALLEEIGSVVARVERQPAVDGVLARFAADRITGQAGFLLRKLGLRHDLHTTGAADLIEQEHFLDRVALRLNPEATCSFIAPARRVMLQFYSHGWSGIAEIRLGDAVERLDLFSERADTRYFIRDLPTNFDGVVEVRCTGDQHILSEGSEVWLQRAFVLESGG